MADPGRPLLNPVLSLRIQPKRDTAQGRGKEAKHIVGPRLGRQRRTLSGQMGRIFESRGRLRAFGGKVQLVAKMFDDSYAPSYTPAALFAERMGMRLVAPYRDGYLIEADVSALPRLAAYIETSDSIGTQVDISRVESVSAYGRDEVLRGRTLDDLWGRAPAIGPARAYIISLAPFRDSEAREQLMGSLLRMVESNILLPTYPTPLLPERTDETRGVARTVVNPEQQGLSIALRRYRAHGSAYSTVHVATKQGLAQLVASGGVFRIDPVPRLEVTTPGTGEHPGPLPPRLRSEPIVGIVDGGRTARTYDQAEAWRETPLIPDGVADIRHGNQVTAMAVHGHAWNTNLVLPKLFCRTGTVQAVPRRGARHITDVQALIAYLGGVFARHPETRVWNFSFNEAAACDPDQVSYLGHELSRIARRHGVLPVISAGNKSTHNSTMIAPPADCEAALVVGGRQFDGSGSPAGPCDVSLPGPGPEGMLKPDLSWFSRLRVLGGDVLTATSFCTPLISSLAAHTFHNLKDAAPDLVRALILNRTDLDSFDRHRGWGSPEGTEPWTCEAGAVTLAWRGEMKPGLAHYWEKIPIPRQMIQDGALKGRAALTAIIEPMVSSSLGGNYFASRIQVALQYRSRKGQMQNLLGSMKTDDATEAEARAELQKWSPVRRHMRDFSRGVSFSGDSFRLSARVFVRDLFQFDNMQRNEDVPPLKVVFVMTLSDGSATSDLYNEMRATLGAFVESAVIEHDVHVESPVPGGRGRRR